MNHTNDRLHMILGAAALKPLRQRLIKKIQQDQPLTGRLMVTPTSAEERASLEKLTGRQPRTGSGKIPVDLDTLAERLAEAGIAADLRSAIEALEGPVVNLAQRKIQRQDAWDHLLQHHQQTPAFAQGEPPWLQTSGAVTLLKRLSKGNPANADEMLQQADAVLSHLPHHGITRAVLAAEVLGDAHALDKGRPTTILLQSILQHNTPGASLDASALETDSWEYFGIEENYLTRTVLVLNLPVAPDNTTWFARLLRLYAETGEPARLTLRQLRHIGPEVFLPGRKVYTCENTAVIAAAADSLGAHSAPIVCVSGRPGSAVHRLLSLLTQADCMLYHHSDFDPAGLSITQQLIQTHGAQPWHMSATDYRDAIAAGRGFATASRQTIPDTAWDPALQTCMQQSKQYLHEEAVLETLLKNLSRSSV